MTIAELLIKPGEVDAILGKVITKNDDSGRHGVLIPNAAYGILPAIPNFDSSAAENYTVPITTVWTGLAGPVTRQSNYKHYHRYPERRITALRSRELDNAAPGTIVIVARRRPVESATYEIVVLDPTNPAYKGLVAELGLPSSDPGLFTVLRDWTPAAATAGYSAAVRRLIGRFDVLSAEGFIPSLRDGGNRGVGNTFEIRMGGEENNRAEADVDGVELKAMLKRDYTAGSSGDADLFLKEPKWVDGISRGAERVREYGYVDDEGRTALYSGVKAKPNSHGLSLRVDRGASQLELVRHGNAVATWPFADLQRSLDEKLNDTLYGLADAKSIGGVEHFRYHTLIYCGRPSVEGLLELIEDGAVSLQLRMHVKAGGTLRNHGSQFRVAMSSWGGLFGVVRAVRQREG